MANKELVCRDCPFWGDGPHEPCECSVFGIESMGEDRCHAYDAKLTEESEMKRLALGRVSSILRRRKRDRDELDITHGWARLDNEAMVHGMEGLLKFLIRTLEHRWNRITPEVDVFFDIMFPDGEPRDAEYLVLPGTPKVYVGSYEGDLEELGISFMDEKELKRHIVLLKLEEEDPELPRVIRFADGEEMRYNMIADDGMLEVDIRERS